LHRNLISAIALFGIALVALASWIFLQLIIPIPHWPSAVVTAFEDSDAIRSGASRKVESSTVERFFPAGSDILDAEKTLRGAGFHCSPPDDLRSLRTDMNPKNYSWMRRCRRMDGFHPLLETGWEVHLFLRPGGAIEHAEAGRYAEGL
jgi:hypothetical protein